MIKTPVKWSVVVGTGAKWDKILFGADGEELSAEQMNEVVRIVNAQEKLKKVYERFKHLDSVLVWDAGNQEGLDVFHKAAGDMWVAIKQALAETEEKK